jgi:quercetin dioxygenase-like cupin family protein
MEVKSIPDQPAQDGPEQFFSGTVHVRPLFDAEAPARMACACVTFDPSARSAWHTHPLGQTLVVTAGRGFVQAWGGPIREIKPGDVIWTPPGEKHWHGAAPDSSMTHVAMQELLDGKAVDWMEKVTDEEYLKAT